MALRIMIVEDEPLIALDIEDILSRAGHTVVGSARSMEEALALAAKAKPTVAILDVSLDGKEVGVDVAAELGARYGVRSLFLTGSEAFLVRAMALDIEPLGYVLKPHNETDILDPLKRLG